MISMLGTMYILAILICAFGIPLKKFFSKLSPKQRAIQEAKEEWSRLRHIENHAMEDMMDIIEQEHKYLNQRLDLDRDDFGTEEEYKAEYERLSLKCTEIEEVLKEAKKEWQEATKKTEEAYKKYKSEEKRE